MLNQRLRSTCYDSPMRALLLAILTLALLTPRAWAAEVPPLTRARAAYNAGRFDEAVTAALEARKVKGAGDTAALVLARALLERFRQTAKPEDLVGAREAMRAVDRSRLTPRDQLDFVIGLGQTLFLDKAFGAAAEVLLPVLDGQPLLPVTERARLLDWWAGALDREAQLRLPERRSAIYARVVATMERELTQNPASHAANYWLAAALRGQGDLERAWDTAAAGWVRAGLTAEVTVALRAELDRLVTEVLIVERSRQRAPREQAEAALAFRAEWDAFKSRWP